MKFELDHDEFRAAAEAALARALEKGGIVEAIKDASMAALASKGLLDKEAAARYFGIEPRTLEIWIRPLGERGGKGVPHLKIGETVRFKLASLEAWAAQHELNRVVTIAA